MEETRLFDELFQDFVNDKKLYDTITEISKSESKPYDSAVVDERRIFSFDEFSKRINKIICQKEEGKSRHSSVDGFHYRKRKNGKLELFFIEFKVITRNRFSESNYRKFLKNIIKPSLKLKPLESLDCILPNLFFNYCSDEIADKLFDLIHKSDKYYICVILNPDISISDAQNIINSDYMDITRLAPYPFKKVLVYSPKKFVTFLNNSKLI